MLAISVVETERVSLGFGGFAELLKYCELFRIVTNCCLLHVRITDYFTEISFQLPFIETADPLIR